MKNIKCDFCKKRYTKQQEWKTEAEKIKCATCRAFLAVVEMTQKALNKIAVDNKIPYTMVIVPTE